MVVDGVNERFDAMCPLTPNRIQVSVYVGRVICLLLICSEQVHTAKALGSLSAISNLEDSKVMNEDARRSLPIPWTTLAAIRVPIFFICLETTAEGAVGNAVNSGRPLAMILVFCKAFLLQI